MRSRTFRTATAAVLGWALIAVVTACSGGGSGGEGQQQADGGGPVTLRFWAWAPNIDKVVDRWNAKHPDVQVKVSTQAQGDDLVTKLLTSNKAGNPPDLAQAEYQALPSLVTAGVATDMTEQTEPVADAFSSDTWGLVSFGGNRYAVPQDIAPMMLFYRHDLFERFDLSVPKTWDEFAQTAESLHEQDPKRYLTTFSSNDAGWFAGLSQQAGASWWQVKGEAWDVSITDGPTQQVAGYWQDLISRDVVNDQPMYTPQWNKEMNNGTLLAWPSAVWGPQVLAGIAPGTKGKWSMAPMPTWDGAEQTGYWGGSSTIVTEKSPHQDEAAEFARWLNTDPEALEALVTEGSLYPAAVKGQQTPALEAAPAFMPNQPDFFARAAQITQTARGFTWGPNVNVTYSEYKDAFNKAIQDDAPFSDALESMQQAAVQDMERSGFKTTG